jgi:hypothetical protein
MSHDQPPKNKDKVIADTGWGVKPDDQPANRNEASAPSDQVTYDPKLPDIIRNLLRMQRRSFNTANRVRVEPGKTTIIDINGDGFTINGLSYGNPHTVELLMELGAIVDPLQFKELPPDCPEMREYKLNRAWAWGHERSGG